MKNPIAKILKIVSYVVLAIGILASILWATDEYEFIYFVAGTLGSVIGYAPIRGLAEVIELLQSIKDK